MRPVSTYIIETDNALFTLVVTETDEGGPYSASYIGTSPKFEQTEIDDDDIGPAQEDLEGELEDADFDALLAACHREIVERGGEIVSIEDISDDDDEER
jgi:hypothetical protein